MKAHRQIQIDLIKLVTGERLLRLTEAHSGLALEKKLGPKDPVVPEKAKLLAAFANCKFPITVPAKPQKKFRPKAVEKLVFSGKTRNLNPQPHYGFSVEKMHEVIRSAKNFRSKKSAHKALVKVRGYDRDEL